MATEIQSEQNDLELVKEFIQLLQAGGSIHFGNDHRYVDLAKRPKAQEAFSIAFQAVFKEDIQPESLRFLFETLQGMGFWMREWEEARRLLRRPPTEDEAAASI